MRGMIMLLLIALVPSAYFFVRSFARRWRGRCGSDRVADPRSVEVGGPPCADNRPVTTGAPAAPRPFTGVLSLNGVALGECSFSVDFKKTTPAAATAGVRADRPATKQEKCMRNLARQPSQRQQITLCAGERALMRWYPGAPLSRIQALRNQRARYPLIEGGKRDDARQAPFTCGHGAGGAA